MPGWDLNKQDDAQSKDLLAYTTYRLAAFFYNKFLFLLQTQYAGFAFSPVADSFCHNINALFQVFYSSEGLALKARFHSDYHCPHGQPDFVSVVYMYSVFFKYAYLRKQSGYFDL